MEYNERIKELRNEFGLSQMQLSQKTGISQSAIAKWELKKTEPTVTNIIVLSRFFNVSTDYLLGIEE